MRILIVEDNEGDQVLLRKAFHYADRQVQLNFVTTTEEAAVLLKKETVNLILLDLNLPGKGGKDFLKEFRSDNIYRKIPIVILTSSEAEKDISECYSLGASGYLTKPSNFKELEEMVEALCHFWGKVTFARN